MWGGQEEPGSRTCYDELTCRTNGWQWMTVGSCKVDCSTIDNKCVECSNNSCTKCQNSFRVSNGRCEAIPEDCSVLDVRCTGCSNGICTRCQRNWQPSSSGARCIPVEEDCSELDRNCVDCSYGVCTQCKKDFKLNSSGTRCIAVQEDCTKIDIKCLACSNGACTKCPHHFKLINNKCSFVPLTCKDIDVNCGNCSNGVCTNCAKGYKPSRNGERCDLSQCNGINDWTKYLVKKNLISAEVRVYTKGEKVQYRGKLYQAVSQGNEQPGVENCISESDCKSKNIQWLFILYVFLYEI